MRSLFTLLVTVALATSAGCFGNDDEGEDTPAVTSPATTPATGTTPTGTPTNPTAPTNDTEPEAPAPRDVCTVGPFSFSGNVQPGAPPTETTTADCGTMAVGHTKLTLNVTFTVASGSPVVVTQGVSVSVVDSAGTNVVTCTGPGAGQAPAAPVECSMEATAAPGAYTLVYQGAGNIDVSGVVTAS